MLSHLVIGFFHSESQRTRSPKSCRVSTPSKPNRPQRGSSLQSACICPASAYNPRGELISRESDLERV